MASISTAPAARTTATTPYAAIAYDVLRIVTALLFMQHGLQKLFGMFGGVGPNGGTVTFPSQFWFAGVIETFGGLLIALGLFTRAAAFIASGEMAVAYFQAHFPQNFFPIKNRGEVVILFCFVFLTHFFTGAGPLSLDAILRRNRGGADTLPTDGIGERGR